METPQELLGSRIRDLRKAAGHTQRDLARICKLHIRTISSIETGEAWASLPTLEVIAKELNCDLMAFFSWGPEKPLTPSIALDFLAKTLKESERDSLSRWPGSVGRFLRFCAGLDDSQIPLAQAALLPVLRAAQAKEFSEMMDVNDDTPDAGGKVG